MTVDLILLRFQLSHTQKSTRGTRKHIQTSATVRMRPYKKKNWQLSWCSMYRGRVLARLPIRPVDLCCHSNTVISIQLRENSSDRLGHPFRSLTGIWSTASQPWTPTYVGVPIVFANLNTGYVWHLILQFNRTFTVLTGLHFSSRLNLLLV